MRVPYKVCERSEHVARTLANMEEEEGKEAVGLGEATVG